VPEVSEVPEVPEVPEMAGVEREAERFIRRTKVALVATRSPKLRPFMTPLWFAMYRGEVYLGTGRQSWVGRNVTLHPAVTMVFGGERGSGERGSGECGNEGGNEGGTAPGRVVRLRGLASCESGLLPGRVLVLLAIKYYLTPRALLLELRHRAQWRLRRLYHRQSAGGAGYIRVVPTSVEFLAQP
jgi:Pyridoxamine 5'-phosphate oxidase